MAKNNAFLKVLYYASLGPVEQLGQNRVVSFYFGWVINNQKTFIKWWWLKKSLSLAMHAAVSIWNTSVMTEQISVLLQPLCANTKKKLTHFILSQWMILHLISVLIWFSSSWKILHHLIINLWRSISKALNITRGS